MAKRFEDAEEYTKKYKSRLHPCKYCGNKDIRIATDRGIFGETKNCNLWSVVCSTPYCDCTGCYTRVKEAVEDWENNH